MAETAVLPGQRTIPALLEEQAIVLGERPLLRVGELELSFREFRDVAATYSGTLLEAGVSRGDRVAVMLDDYTELLQLWAACAWSGAILVPIHSAFRGAQLARVLANAGPQVLATDATHLREIAALGSLPAELRDIWVVGDDVAGIPARITCTPFPDPGPPVGPASLGPGDSLAILYTSGTTGPAKGVCCPHAQFYWYGVNTAAMLGVQPDDVLYTCLPFFHINAFATLMQAILTGAQIVVGPHFSASHFWKRVKDADATITYLLGAMVSILAGRDPVAEESLHRVRTALAPATPPHLYDLFRDRFGIALIDAWAMTETNAVIGPVDGEQRPGYMGRVFPGFEARVVDHEDDPVADGLAGELVVRSDHPFAFSTGYWRSAESTVASWRNLWFHTGDRVIREPDGYYKHIDRLKDVIRRRGENISAWEVEQVLQIHPQVVTSAVVPVPSELGEDEVMAYVVRQDGAQVSEAEIVAHCESRIAYFAIPRYIEFVGELPLTETGKVQKFVLRQRGVTAATWDRTLAGSQPVNLPGDGRSGRGDPPPAH
jgi:crotonobetaine/carnitine-CoA ligase